MENTGKKKTREYPRDQRVREDLRLDQVTVGREGREKKKKEENLCLR